jgi:hypothetical protein
VADYFEHGNEISGSIKDNESIGQISDYQLLTKSSLCRFIIPRHVRPPVFAHSFYVVAPRFSV